jgi:hypothetical protein
LSAVVETFSIFAADMDKGFPVPFFMR